MYSLDGWNWYDSPGFYNRIMSENKPGIEERSFASKPPEQTEQVKEGVSGEEDETLIICCKMQ